MIDVLLAPLRLPARALEDLDALADAVRRLPAHTDQVAALVRSRRAGRDITRHAGPMRAELERIGGHMDGLAQRLSQIDAHVATLEPRMARLEDEVARTRRLLEALKGDLENLSEHLPAGSRPGPIARAREAITGGE